MPRFPSRHAVIDTETGYNGEFRLGVVLPLWKGGELRTYTDEEKMRQAVSSLHGAVVWGHNVSYDLLVLWKGSLGAWFMNGHFRRASLGSVEFRDTLSFFEMPLADAAGLVGMQKTGDGADSRAYSLAQLAGYCADDCKATAGLVRSILDFAGEHGVEEDATGPGAWARALWAKTCGWLGDYPDDRAFRFPDGMVRGGLVKFESGELGAGEKWDIKSAYPWQMWHGSFPDLCQIGHGRHAGLPALIEARGRWYAPEEADCLGLRPTRVLRAPVRAWGRPFRGFVEEVMQARNRAKQAGDRAGDYLCKRVLNSLSGCLGARTMQVYIKDGVARGGKRLRAIPGTRAIWASLVTGRQRARLLRAWGRARRPLYGDTDSILCEHFEPDTEGNELCGRWGLEERFTGAYVLGPKMYATLAGSEITTAHVKGIPRKRAAEAIRKYREKGETVIEWDSVVTYREAYGAPHLWIKRERDPFKSLRERQAAK